MTKKTVEKVKLNDMKKVFLEYYPDNDKTEKEIWETAIFCLDANVMLELYRMPEKTRNSYFEIFEQIKDRVIIPYQSMTEFFNNRFEVIKDERLNYESVLDGLITSLGKTEDNYEKKFRNPVSEIDTLLKEIRKNIEDTNKKIKELRIKQIPSYFDDHILYKLTDLFQTRLHASFSEDELKEFYKEGAKRYKDKRPPGYMDADKGGNRQYGDYIIWEEMKSISRVEKVSIIFISNDKKEDWRHTKGASHVRHELLEEFKKDTKHQFFMYKLENLPEKVKEFLEPRITDFVDDVHVGYSSKTLPSNYINSKHFIKLILVRENTEKLHRLILNSSLAEEWKEEFSRECSTILNLLQNSSLKINDIKEIKSIYLYFIESVVYDEDDIPLLLFETLGILDTCLKDESNLITERIKNI